MKGDDEVKTLLIVEDDMTLNKGIKLTLTQDHLTILQAYDIANAEKILHEASIDLIILDINLPDGSGLDFCERIRQKSQVPIIFLTANDLEIDIVTGFELGGDDYITKPFSLMVFRARVMAILRRIDTDRLDKISIDNHFTFDFGKMEFRKGMDSIILSRTEQRLLRVLISNRGNILTREQLMEKVWGQEAAFIEENALTVSIKRLRGKIEDDPSKPKFIQTVYGFGYTWSGEQQQ